MTGLISVSDSILPFIIIGILVIAGILIAMVYLEKTQDETPV